MNGVVSNCPVIHEAEQILNAQREITKQLHHFKGTLNRCGKCENDGSCGALDLIHQQIDVAIKEVAEEWGL